MYIPSDPQIWQKIGHDLSEPQDAQESAWLDYAINASAEDRVAFRSTLSAADQAKFDAMRELMVGKMGAANDAAWARVA